MCSGLVWFGSGFRSACALERKDLGGGGFFLGEMGYDGYGVSEILGAVWDGMGWGSLGGGGGRSSWEGGVGMGMGSSSLLGEFYGDRGGTLAITGTWNGRGRRC